MTEESGEEAARGQEAGQGRNLTEKEGEERGWRLEGQVRKGQATWPRILSGSVGAVIVVKLRGDLQALPGLATAF